MPNNHSILIADVGMTKGDWFLFRNNQFVNAIQTQGIHPILSDKKDSIEQCSLVCQKLESHPYQMIFLGTGCSQESNQKILSSYLREVFPTCKNMIVKSDVLGACLALSFNQKSIVALLGSGCHACLYDGNEIHHAYLNSGFLFGNEGSGFSIGRKILKLYFEGNIGETISTKIEEKTRMQKADLLFYIYSLQQPFSYIASFTSYLPYDIEMESKIVTEELNSFFENHIRRYKEHKNIAVHFWGSIAFHFEKYIDELCIKKGIQKGVLEKNFSNALLNNPASFSNIMQYFQTR